MDSIRGLTEIQRIGALEEHLRAAQARIAELEGELKNCMTALGYWGSCDDCPKGKELESQRDKAVAEVERLKKALKAINKESGKDFTHYNALENIRGISGEILKELGGGK